MREHEQRQRQVAAVEPSVPAMSFVPVQIEHAQQLPSTVMVKLQARLPNGVVLDVHDCDVERAGELIEALARLRCSA